eukprot:TRINITY_DN103816_c0_g1_i1.p1 TRINITY_DN103816_c0_g1~~TRINITY_DN103816_c0_g1_i1.p1  ORF type:complete len:284 (+),score=74.45 TRINITY_DN103816_c0_g1_i1:95-946(+)
MVSWPSTVVALQQLLLHCSFGSALEIARVSQAPAGSLQEDALDGLQRKDPKNYAIVETLLMKRSFNVLDYEHPMASFHGSSALGRRKAAAGPEGFARLMSPEDRQLLGQQRHGGDDADVPARPSGQAQRTNGKNMYLAELLAAGRAGRRKFEQEKQLEEQRRELEAAHPDYDASTQAASATTMQPEQALSNDSERFEAWLHPAAARMRRSHAQSSQGIAAQPPAQPASRDKTLFDYIGRSRFERLRGLEEDPAENEAGPEDSARPTPKPGSLEEALANLQALG